MNAQLVRVGIVVGVAAAAALAGSYVTRMSEDSASAPPQITASIPDASTPAALPDPRLLPPPGSGQGAPPPAPIPQAIPVTEGPILPQPTPMLPPPVALPETAPSHPHHHGYRASPGLAPSAPAPEDMPPAAAADPIGGGAAPPSEKVLSYFQKSKTQIDTKMAFGFVLFPRVAITAEEKQTQMDFCQTVLASLDFMTPGAVSEAVAEHHEILATYWPIDASRNSFEVSTAFAARDCDDLIAWYDHKLARALAARAGVSQLGGPLLITWPSSGASERDRDPLVVDFSKANHERATKALQYWFRQLRNKPELWTNRIREGTIRAELADAVNDTAGVMLSVLSGKWDTLTTVTASATP